MTYVTGGGAQNTFDIVHNQDDDDPVTNLENITVIGGPGAGATDTLDPRSRAVVEHRAGQRDTLRRLGDPRRLQLRGR